MPKLRPFRNIAISGMATKSSDFKLAIELIESHHDIMVTVNISLEMLQLALFLKNLVFYQQDFSRLEQSLSSGSPMDACVEDVDGAISISNQCNGHHLILELSWDIFYPWVEGIHKCDDPTSGSKLCIKGLVIGSCTISRM